MAVIDQNIVSQHLASAAGPGATSAQKGKALEDLICYLFSVVPGVSITKRNALNQFESEEVDVALWNEMNIGGLAFLPSIILIECKNWSARVGSAEVSWFDGKLRSRGLDFGIFVAVEGITGNAHDLTAAHKIVSDALREKRRIVVMTKEEIQALVDSDGLVHLLKEKLCNLAVSGAAL